MLITGKVQDQAYGYGIDGAFITTTGGGAAISVVGEYDLYQKPGKWTLQARAAGYASYTNPLIVEAGGPLIIGKDIIMDPTRTSECRTNSDCDDGVYCNGTEMCIGGECSPGVTPPCENDGFFCNGVESCDEENDSCLSPGNPCAPTLTCNEENDVCEGCLQDIDCYDGFFCSGVETCVDGVCQPGAERCPDDGLFCNGVESCDEVNNVCLQSGNPCPDGTTCVEESDKCVSPPPEIVLTPDSWFQSRWIPVLVLLGIEGSGTHFGAPTTVTFNPTGAIFALPLVVSEENLYCIGLLVPQWLTGPLGGSVDVTVTTGAEEAYEALNINLLPFILDEGKDPSTPMGR